jgi:hypothetical protein
VTDGRPDLVESFLGRFQGRQQIVPAVRSAAFQQLFDFLSDCLQCVFDGRHDMPGLYPIEGG